MSIIRQYAEENDIRDIMVAGDLFHDRVNINISVLNNVYDELNKAVKINQKWHIFPGNHDMFLKNSWKITSLHILNNIHQIYENVTIIKLDEQRFWIVPFIYYEKDYMEVINKINLKASKEDVLITHIGVNGATLNECFLLKNWNIVDFKDTIFRKIFTGHFHCYQSLDDRVYYPGSPIPFKFDEGVVDHGFIIYDTEDNSINFIKIREVAKEFSNYLPPDFITILDVDLDKNKHWCKGNNVKLIITEDKTSNEIMEMKKLVYESGAVSVTQALPKKEIKTVKELSRIPSSPDDFFKEYVKQDDPKLDIKLLDQLHDIIKKEVDQRRVIEEVEEDA